MLNVCSSFLSWLIDTLVQFLSSEPIIWFVGGFCCLIVVKLLKSLMHI